MDTATEQAAPDDGAVASRVVLFDFDGVIVHGDTFARFARQRYARAPWRVLVAALALPWLLVQWPFSRWLPLRTLVHIGLLGLDEARYAHVARAFAVDLVRRPRQFSREAIAALRRHVADGDRVLIVSGCEQVLLEAVLAELGLDGLEVVASRLRAAPFGLRVKRHLIGAAKPRELAALGVQEWRRAYSDSARDVPMLRPAAEAVLVNATPARCRRVEQALGRAVLRVEWF